MFRHVCGIAGVCEDAIIHVGDDPWFDIEGAHRAGVGSVWINRHGRPWPAEQRPAQAEISSLHELPASVERLWRLLSGPASKSG